MLTKGTILNGKSLTGFSLLTETPTAFRLLEFTMDIPQEAEGLNPYREEEVAITASFVSATGKQICVDAFYYENYTYNEQGEPMKNGDTAPAFRVRAALPEAGEWQLTVNLSIHSKTIDTLKECLSIAENAEGSVLLQVEPSRHQMFTKPDGTPVPLIGENLWRGEEPLSKRVVRNMKRLAPYGVNHIRLIDGELNGGSIRGGLYTMRQDISAMWDSIVETAEELSMYLSFTFLHHTEAIVQPLLEKTIWHQNNGGPITAAENFFSDATILDALKCYMRYVNSRFGYSERIFTFEFFHEFDRGAPLQKGKHRDVLAWYEELISYWRGIDPYKHLLSGSLFCVQVFPLYQHFFDFIYYHQRLDFNIHHLADMQKSCVRMYQKPALFGDCGLEGFTKANVKGEEAELNDIHQHNWIGVMGGGAGTCMTTAWDKIEANNKEICFKAVSEMADRIPWLDTSLKCVTEETVPCSHHQMGVMGYTGADYAYLWVYDTQFVAIRFKERLFEDQTLSISLEDGAYTVCYYNTQTGEELEKSTQTATGGVLTLTMPAWSKDIAVTVTR